MNKPILTVPMIAKLCHDLNRSYCQTIGDTSQLPWDEAPEWQRQSAMTGVSFRLGNPSAPVEAQHEAWMSSKLDDGWVYGSVKDPKAKTHPCLVSYENLPPEQRFKDALFIAVVDACNASENSVTIREVATRTLYETYCASVGGVAYDGKPLPNWMEFSSDPAKTKQADGWRAVAERAATL